MSAYVIEVKYPTCDPFVDLECVTESRTCGTQSSAITKCPNCSRTFQVLCFLRSAGDGFAKNRQRKSRRRRKVAA